MHHLIGFILLIFGLILVYAAIDQTGKPKT